MQSTNPQPLDRATDRTDRGHSRARALLDVHRLDRAIDCAGGSTEKSAEESIEKSTEERWRSKLSRGLTLLKSFRAQDDEVPMSEIARRTSLPKPTVHRLIKELVEEGFLERGPNGLRLGHVLFLLGSRTPGYQMLRQAAMPYLQRLNEVTGGSACLSVADGFHVVRLDAVHSHALPAGRYTEYHSLCARATRRALALPTGPPGTTEGCSSRQETVVSGTRGLIAVSAPVPDLSGTPVAALSVVGTALHLRPEIAARHTRGAARTLARQLSEDY